MDNKETYLSIDDAAKLANVHERTIRNWINQGYLTKYKIVNNVRILESELLKFISPRKAK